MDAVYEPLPLEGNHIRLLEVKVRRSFLGLVRELVCNFRVVSLDDNDNTLKYTALSYAWDDPTPVRKIQLANGRSLPLSRTLSNLIDSLQRQGEDSFTIWVDALCINQNDLIEKASQVRMMGDVYSKAKQVLVWLGASTPQSKRAFRFMSSKQGASYPDDWGNESDRAGLKEVFLFLDRPWFRRVWVIQEVILGSNVLMACGDDRIDFDIFRNCTFGIWLFLDTLNHYGADNPSVRGLWCFNRMIHIRETFQADGAVGYETCLEAAFHVEATDPRDKVYAFRGIAHKDSSLLPEPDYAVPVEQVYRETAEALLCHGQSLDLLALCGIAFREHPSILPTWAPDPGHPSFTEPFAMCDRGNWNVGGTLMRRPSIVPPNQLRLQVNFFGTVVETCPTFDAYLVGHQQVAVRAALAMRQRAPGNISEAAWKDAIAVSMTFGLDVDDEPAGPEYRTFFEEWLQWLQSSTSQDDLDKISGNKFQQTIGPRVDGWRAFMTQQGPFGIGPAETRVGDAIYLVPGCRLPLVLRHDPDASDTVPLPEKILVGWCYVYGLMHGRDISPGEPNTDILLR
ncbi:HET-domain-containing protein [Parathielavia appendiculata]|uniref:HET-domain-containing protein n=1 Tax=Parathielavia appendiculata TaxID=2587402 RepID=A0AAN6Z594_9PEZI|nr:HET-domain-containing protein [Parathielavia appendiculata]